MNNLGQSALGLKVLLLNEFFYPDDQGGSGSATSYFARRLVDEYGVEVTVVTSRYAYRDPSVRYSRTDEWQGIKIHRVVSPNWGRLKAVSRLNSAKRLVGNLVLAYSVAWKAIRLPKADVTLVLTNPFVMPIAAKLVKAIRGTPYTYLVYDVEPERIVTLKVKPEKSQFVRSVRKWQSGWLNNAGNIIAIGRCMRDLLIKQYSLDPKKVLVVEIGQDPEKIVPLPRDTEFRRKYGITGFMMLYSGNFGRYHDFDTILDAAERLQPSFPDIHFALVGTGFKKDYILEQIDKRKLTNVKVYGFVPEAEYSDLLASADIQVITLEPGMEGICVPGKFYTSLSSGRPVLALMRPVSEVARVIAENDLGYCVEVGDVDGLIRVVLEGRANPEKFDEMGCRAREVLVNQYTASHVTQRMVAALVACKARK